MSKQEVHVLVKISYDWHTFQEVITASTNRDCLLPYATDGNIYNESELTEEFCNLLWEKEEVHYIIKTY